MQIVDDEMLQQLGFAVPGAAENPVVFDPRLQGNDEGDWHKKEIEKRRAA